MLLVLPALLAAVLPTTAHAAAPSTALPSALHGVKVRPAARGLLHLGPATRHLSTVGTTASSVVAAPAPSPALSTWQVTYTGFTPQAQAAFQAAVDIWARIIRSPVPIRVDAQFADLGTGVLGSAGATQDVSAPGLGDGVSYYPSALADDLAGSDLYGTDISAQFSSTYGFSFATDGSTPANQIDFESVVLHELGHGLGFAGFMDDGAGSGSYQVQGRFDAFSYDAPVGGSRLTSLAPAGTSSPLLGSALTSGAVYWGGAAGTAADGGLRPKLYAPSTWQPGSSYSHLDEATYPAGDPNSLMTYAIGPGEVVHSPGPVAVGILDDLGWQAALPAAAPADTVPPTLAVGTVAPFALGPVPVSFSATDSGSGVKDYLVRTRRAPYNGSFGPYGSPVTTTAHSYLPATARGWTSCTSVAAKDVAGNTTPWSADRCTSVPLDDRSLSATWGFTRLVNSGAYAGTYSRSLRLGQYVRLASATGRRLALVVTTCSTCGSVKVTFGGSTKSVSLASATTHWRALLVLDFSTVRTGAVTVTTLSAKQVIADGLGVSRL